MINIDLSKTPALRYFVYLHSFFPGLFFLVSVAIGNPGFARFMINRVEAVHPISPYALLALLLAAGFVIGQAIVLLAWLIETTLAFFYRLPKKIHRKLFGNRRVYVWFAKLQGMPPKTTRLIRLVGRVIFSARGDEPYSEDSKATWYCLTAATEILLEKRYGISKERATGPGDLEWSVWNDVVGLPVKTITDSLNAGRTIFGCGLAGLLALTLAPSLANRYYILLSAVFVVCGLWTGAYYFLARLNPTTLNIFGLKSVLLELREFTSETAKSNEPK
jgi:uncharacterized membrane protein YciS (DUF1049 family)